jgi:hypothetical protein
MASLGSLLLLLAPLVAAQFPSQQPNLTTIKSPIDESITVSYKVPEGACKTAFSSQKQYTGWVNVPGNDYPTNLFFWFVAAREPTSVLTIWLNGGPGASSMFGFFNGAGPCGVVEKGLDQYETIAREWGWDRASNMLFIDQVSCCVPEMLIFQDTLLMIILRIAQPSRFLLRYPDKWNDRPGPGQHYHAPTPESNWVILDLH